MTVTSGILLDKAPDLRVVHPLDDVPEEKLYHGGLGRIAMTPAVRISLLALRGYLILMVLLVAYRTLSLMGA
ncbi:MAG: hypothetical protein M0006_13015 [Magnetospirillum sp.]|nr:hypothetical protein [Magnetospirillum sp.]